MLYNGTLVLNARHAPFEAKGFADLYGRQIILYQISLKKKKKKKGVHYFALVTC